MKFVYDEENYIVDAQGDEIVVEIPKRAKGIRSYAFLNLPIKEIFFEHTKLDICEAAFVGLENLETIDCRYLCKENLLSLFDSFSDNAKDLCFIIKNSLTDFIEKYDASSYCLFLAREVDFDLSQFFEFELTEDEAIITKTKTNLRSNGYPEKNVYFPDYYKGKKLVLDISKADVYDSISLMFRKAHFVKLPIIRDDFDTGIAKLSFKKSKLKNLHLSRLANSIPRTCFWECHFLRNVFIPKNYKSLAGFSDCANLGEVIFEDSSNIKEVSASVFANTALSRSAFEKNEIFYLEDMAIRFQSFTKRSELSTNELTFKDGTRLISDGFMTRQIPNRFKSMHIPDSVEIIGEKAFYDSCDCDIYLGTGIKTIGSKAFAYEYWEGEEPSKRKIYWKNDSDSIKYSGTDVFEGIMEELPFK